MTVVELSGIKFSTIIGRGDASGVELTTGLDTGGSTGGGKVGTVMLQLMMQMKR
jgi:hypothetical protein